MNIQSLCPDISIWQMILISVLPEIYVIHLVPLKREARCPICGTFSPGSQTPCAPDYQTSGSSPGTGSSGQCGRRRPNG